MQVSFIIPLYNGLAYTRECLRSLQGTLSPELEHEIIFVDDGSTDGTRDWLASLTAPCRTVLNEQNLGFAGACNRGAAVARGDTLFFLNNDLVLTRAWFEPMHALLARADAGLIGNLQFSARTGALDHAGVRFDEKGKPVHDLGRPLIARVRGWREVPAVTGACLAVRRTVWSQLGGFDEGFRNGGEDIDLALRARAAGLRTRVSLRSAVLHHVSASAGRKLRDEQNSRRLALRWRAEITQLSARAWSGHVVSTIRHEGAVPDLALSFEILALFLGLRRYASAKALAAIDSCLEIEFARWRKLLDGETESPAIPLPRTGVI